MNKNQKLLLVISLTMFWLTIILIPNCGGMDSDVCGAMDGFEFMWSSELVGVYFPMLMLEWLALTINFICLFFYFKDSSITKSTQQPLS